MSWNLKGSLPSSASATLIALAMTLWAVPLRGAAHTFLFGGRKTYKLDQKRVSLQTFGASGERLNRSLPGEVRFRESEGQGLLVQTWVNGVGPFRFALDTGAGATLINGSVAQAARVVARSGRAINIGGLSGAGSVYGHEAQLRSLAIGFEGNLLPAKGLVIVASGLPGGVDGILDPTEAYWPLGYTIDLPRGLLRAFDPRSTPLRVSDAPPGGAVVPWLFDAESRRPFVQLNGAKRALLDTGSGFGLAISESAASAFGIGTGSGRERDGSRDLGGGRITARRIRPLTVRIGPLTLYRVPTDLLTGVESGSPLLLGREALAPFELSFDPANRLIRFTPTRDN